VLSYAVILIKEALNLIKKLNKIVSLKFSKSEIHNGFKSKVLGNVSKLFFLRSHPSKILVSNVH